MRVALFTDYDFDKINGATTTLRALLRHAPSDLRPRIYTMSDCACEDSQYISCATIGIPIPKLPETRVYAPAVRAFRRQLIADGIDVVHMTTPGPVGLTGRYLAGRLGLPLVGSCDMHVGEYAAVVSGSPWFGRLVDSYARWAYAPCQQLLVPSNATRERLRAAAWNTGRVTLWPRGVDAHAFNPGRRSNALREAWHVSEKRAALLYAGSVSKEKGVRLLEPLSAFLHRHRMPHRLIVAGDGPLLSELRTACPDAVVLGQVARDQMGVVMASADLCLFPTETETAGSVVLEAQACGVPVLVSQTGSHRELIEHGETGFACAPGDVSDFGARAIALLTSLPRRTEMGAAARALAVHRSWRSSLEPLLATYRFALAHDARPALQSPEARRGGPRGPELSRRVLGARGAASPRSD